MTLCNENLTNFFESLHKEEWREVRLGEVGKVITGKTPSQNNPQDWGDSMLFITPTDYKNYCKYASDSARKISNEGVDRFSRIVLPPNSVLVTCIGSDMGKVAINKVQAITNQQINAIIPNNMINYNFLYYSLVDMYPILRIFGTDGTAVPILNKNDFESLTISLPPLPIQNQIAEILSSFDDKIDLLHRQNQTLESLALTLFRHHFIENPNCNEWEKTTLENICLKIQSGGTPSTKQHSYYGGNINWYSTKELNDNFLFKSIQQITDEGLNNSSAKLFPKDSVIIAIYASPTVGRLGILTQESAFNQAACGLVVDETKSSKEFVFLFLKNERENLNLLASGSAQQNLNVEKIKNYPLLLPDKETLDYFQIQAKGFFDKISHNAKEILALEQMRDLVLSKIFNEKMEVRSE
ncbi:restriction endonuclease subunit S [Helicobacter sp. MIT 05-5294]|uniref:restriction endonuclease subunit S n=1 Tax=Helicobacter sp. MIT 05-5294 TaxID=1548150 RepID=UPI001EE7EFE4|nr:restriction endonuclease subunit S [Helicobacter sp. MIT 05-5294]